jgi:hypothetical protein
MGGRQSQEPSPSPVEVTHHVPPPSQFTRHTPPSTHLTHHTPPPTHLTRHTPPPSHLHVPTLSEYPHLHPVPMPHTPSRPGNRLQADRPPTVSRHGSLTSAEQLMELDIALTTLQRRLQARGEARDRPHSHRHRSTAHHNMPHPALLSNGLPLLFLRQIRTLQCPLCSKDVPSSEMEAHMAKCMARPRVTYNGMLLAHTPLHPSP